MPDFRSKKRPDGSSYHYPVGESGLLADLHGIVNPTLGTIVTSGAPKTALAQRIIPLTKFLEQPRKKQELKFVKELLDRRTKKDTRLAIDLFAKVFDMEPIEVKFVSAKTLSRLNAMHAAANRDAVLIDKNLLLSSERLNFLKGRIDVPAKTFTKIILHELHHSLQTRGLLAGYELGDSEIRVLEDRLEEEVARFEHDADKLTEQLLEELS